MSLKRFRLLLKVALVASISATSVFAQSLVGKEFACLNGDRQQNFFVGSDRVFVASKRTRSIDRNWTIHTGSTKGANVGGVFGTLGEMRFNSVYSTNRIFKDANYLRKFKIEMTKGGWACPRQGSKMGNCGKEVVMARSDGKRLMIGNHILFRSAGSSGKNHIIGLQGYGFNHPIRKTERSEYWTIYQLNSNGKLSGYFYGGGPDLTDSGHNVTSAASLVKKMVPEKLGNCVLLN
ncbi:MAG: hypothetical protein ACRBB0_05625 [Pelagimonas sp.]|uniref:hypothetical protein n=1 Tax=Pelagimonas sp. TaxID=2073170 RepID=UPI003D6B41B9